ncbi:MAG: hypothetical protein J3K34DRAFT_442387 [Monoraphidium minutum]|nr:MAG: hypothetical protein J3K34DRAFT_442387 [Monoraphidium minutum]
MEDGISIFTPSRAPPGVVRRAAQTVGQAFREDPYMDVFDVPPRQRPTLFAAIARFVLRQHRHEPCLYVAQGGDAVAVAVPAGSKPLEGRFDAYLSGLWWQAVRMPPAPRAALLQFLHDVTRAGPDAAAAEGVAATRALIFIATAPALRGTGWGRRLLARVTADADAAGEPLQLEASDTGVAALYARYGFTPIGTLDVRGPGPRREARIPLMLRRPGGGGGGAREEAAAAAAAAEGPAAAV